MSTDLVNKIWSIRSNMEAGMDGAVHAAAVSVLRDAKRMAPVRKIFKEGGSAKIQTRSFRVKTEAGWETRQVSVRVHRANKYSTSKDARQHFEVVSPYTEGAIAIHSPGFKTGVVHVKFAGTKNLTARGRWEVANMLKGYEASEAEGKNVNPIQHRTTKTWSRQTMIRVPDIKSIRAILQENAEWGYRIRQLKRDQAKKRSEFYRAGVKEANRLPKRLPAGSGPPRKGSARKVAADGGAALGMEHAIPTRGTTVSWASSVPRSTTGPRTRPEALAALRTKTEQMARAHAHEIRSLGLPASGRLTRASARNVIANPYAVPQREFRGARLSTASPKPGEPHGHFRLQVGGHLRESLAIRDNDRGGKRVSEIIETDVPYAKYMEFGTVHNRPFTFLRPALFNQRERFRNAAKEAVRGALKG